MLLEAGSSVKATTVTDMQLSYIGDPGIPTPLNSLQPIKLRPRSGRKPVTLNGEDDEADKSSALNLSKVRHWDSAVAVSFREKSPP